MSTYNEFSIQDVIADLSQKRIVIKTNFKVDPDSVLPTNIAFYNYDETTLEKYNLIVDNKVIYLVLEEYPKDGARYYLKIKDLKDALGRTLKTSFDDYIRFTTDLISKVKIISPVSRETLKTRNVTVRLAVDNYIANTRCRVQIATDNIFYNRLIDMEQIIEGEEVIVNTTIEKEGQIYLRARAEQDEQIVGDWSELICFNIYTISRITIS